MRIFEPDTTVPADARGAAIALGNFDGVHIGHQAVLADAAGVARARSRAFGVAVFRPHPRALFQPGAPPARLQTNAQRVRALAGFGVERLFEIGFDRALSQLTDRQFCETVLAERLAAVHVSVGGDFRFGRGRMGDAETLAKLGAVFGFSAHAVAPIGGEAKISSTAIRAAIAAGDMTKAAAMLGRPWAIEGEVRRGFQRGRDLGFATANIALGDYVRPRFGVYAVRARIDGAPAAGVASVGVNPTYGDVHEPLLETHLFDFDAELYGRVIEVEMLAFLRGEEKFDSAEALAAQIARDVAHAKAILA